MSAPGHLRRLFAYEWWANFATLEALERAAPPPERALALFAHVIAAQRLWLERLRGEPQSMSVWPALSVAQCGAQLADLRRAWGGFLDGLDQAAVDRTIRYTNTKGEPHASRVGDVLTHVVLHSSYHRGQVAAALRQAGAEPAYTDFIHATRRGFIAPEEGP